MALVDLDGEPRSLSAHLHLTRDGRTETTRHKDPLELLQKLVTCTIYRNDASQP